MLFNERKIKANNGLKDFLGISGGTTDKVAKFDGTKNGTLGSVYTHSGTVTFHDLDVQNNVAALTFVDGATYKLIIGTISGTTVTWGTAVTLNGSPGGNTSVALSTDAAYCAVSYAASGGTNDWKAESYTISGTTPTLNGSLLSVATGNTSTFSCGIAAINGTRFCMMYEANATGYPTVIGIVAGAGTWAKDASATTVQTTALQSGDASKSVWKTSSTTWNVSWNVGSAKPRYCPITDGTTTTSAGTVVQVGAASGSQLAFAADSNAYAAMQDSGGGYSGGLLSTGVASSEYTSSSTDVSGLPLRWPLNTTSEGFRKAIAPLGNVNSDSIYWFMKLVGNNASFTAATGWIEFCGIPADPSQPKFHVYKTVTALTGAATSGVQRGCAKISLSSVLIVYVNTSNDIKSLVIGL